MPISDEQRQLKIKTATLKRSIKDLLYGQKELTREQERLARFVDDNDEDKIYQQKKVIQEAEKDIPRAKERIIKYAGELKDFMARHRLKVSDEDAEDENSAAGGASGGGGNKYDDFSDEEDEENDGAAQGDDTNNSGLQNSSEEAAVARATIVEADDMLALEF